MERLVIHAARRHVYRRLALCLGLLAIGAALLHFRVVPLMGWSLVLLGGGYALVLLRALGEETDRVVMDEAGIRDSQLPLGTIAWTEIRGASVQAIGRVPVVALEVRDPESVLRRLPTGRQFLARKALEAGLPGIYLNLAGTDADPAWVAEAIRRRVQPSGTDAHVVRHTRTGSQEEG
jgi:hypothetical protein